MSTTFLLGSPLSLLFVLPTAQLIWRRGGREEKQEEEEEEEEIRYANNEGRKERREEKEPPSRPLISRVPRPLC